jgi:hypothetical protein
LVATGLKPSEYASKYRCARVVTKWDYINESILEPLKREERAMIDMLVTPDVPDHFIGCARSTFTMAVWALRMARSSSLTNLAYNMNGMGKHKPGELPRCYAGITYTLPRGSL